MKNIPVLIVGGGPVGLSMALALARQNIESIVIERHPSTTNHPKARGVNVRSMELFRQWGNASELLTYEQPREAIRFIWAHSLQGEEVTRIIPAGTTSGTESPAQTSFVTQDQVEKSLYHSLSNYPETEVQFLKEFLSFEEDSEGIIAHVFNRKNHQDELIRARYLIAADGAASPIRKQLNIAMEGPENLGQFCSLYCEIDLSQWTQHRPAIAYLFTDPKFSGRFLGAVDGTQRWIVGLRFSEGISKETFSDNYCLKAIRNLLELPELKIEIINKGFWTMSAQIASRYRHGKVFLSGDAAHCLPPTGGLGMNTGIQDAHNLAWKLAFVLKGHASDSLLDTYYEERAPVAQQNMEWSLENAKRYTDINKAIREGDQNELITKLHEQQKNFNYEGLDLGFIYHSKAILSENNQCISVAPSEYHPTTLPGSRAPHAPLLRSGQVISTLDLFEKEFVLLVGSEGTPWLEAACNFQKESSFPLKSYRVAVDGDLVDPNNIWHELYEITKTGAVLIRPDGHVAWRSHSLMEQAKEVLVHSFSCLVRKKESSQ